MDTQVSLQVDLELLELAADLNRNVSSNEALKAFIIALDTEMQDFDSTSDLLKHFIGIINSEQKLADIIGDVFEENDGKGMHSPMYDAYTYLIMHLITKTDNVAALDAIHEHLERYRAQLKKGEKYEV